MNSPEPLLQHFAATADVYGRAVPFWAGDDQSYMGLPVPENLRSIIAKMKDEDRTAMTMAVMERVEQRQHDMIAGIRKYQNTEKTCPRATVETAWAKGSSKLLCFSDVGKPILIVPSLINTYHILDVTKQRSWVRWLTSQGWRVYVLDWGEPENTEIGFHISDYIQDRLVPAMNSIEGDFPAIGYCMGGILLASAVQLMPQKISKMAMVGVPWDYSSPNGNLGRIKNAMSEIGTQNLIAYLSLSGGVIPKQMLLSFFAALDPTIALKKFRKFNSLPIGSAEGDLFIAIEDWLHAGPSLASGAAQDILVNWLLKNELSTGNWRINSNEKLAPMKITTPTMVAAAQNDIIAPSCCVEPIVSAFPNSTLIRPNAGHVGMIAGSRAQAELWEPIHQFMAS